MKSLKRIIYRFFANLYLEKRGKIPADELKQRTLKLILKFREKAENLTLQQLDSRLDAEGWNVSEVAYHAVNSVKGILRICEGLRNEKDVPPMEGAAMGRSKSGSREDLVALCERVYGLVEQMDFTGASKKKTAHPLLGPGDFRRWLVINMVHLERHYKQLLQTASLPAQ